MWAATEFGKSVEMVAVGMTVAIEMQRTGRTAMVARRRGTNSDSRRIASEIMGETSSDYVKPSQRD